MRSCEGSRALGEQVGSGFGFSVWYFVLPGSAVSFPGPPFRAVQWVRRGGSGVHSLAITCEGAPAQGNQMVLGLGRSEIGRRQTGILRTVSTGRPLGGRPVGSTRVLGSSSPDGAAPPPVGKTRGFHGLSVWILINHQCPHEGRHKSDRHKWWPPFAQTPRPAPSLQVATTNRLPRSDQAQ